MNHFVKQNFFKVQTFLFAFSCIMYAAGSSIAASHPLLSLLFATLETVGWICILLSWGIASIEGIRCYGPKLWTKVCTHICLKKNHGLVVPVEQLAHLRDNVQRLGLALHGMSPEMEMARRTHFLMLGAEEVPPLVLPPQNASLYAEFESLVRTLNHFGFPCLERVRLQPKDFAFIQQWGSDLEARLHQHQKRTQEQQTALCAALTAVMQQQKTLGETYAWVHNDSGYHQIQGALRLLENMTYDQRCSWDLAQICMQQLQSNLDTLKQQYEQAVG